MTADEIQKQAQMIARISPDAARQYLNRHGFPCSKWPLKQLQTRTHTERNVGACEICQRKNLNEALDAADRAELELKRLRAQAEKASTPMTTTKHRVRHPARPMRYLGRLITADAWAYGYTCPECFKEAWFERNEIVHMPECNGIDQYVSAAKKGAAK